jgi:hypothetical protein
MMVPSSTPPDDRSGIPQPSAPPTDEAPGGTGKPGRLRVGLVGGAAVALVVGVAATSLAATPSPTAAGPTSMDRTALTAPGPALSQDDLVFDHGRFGRFGLHDITITAISGTDVTLGTEDGWRRTITITDAIDLTKGGRDIAVGDLKVGDQVRFSQTRSADGTYTVDALAVVVPTVRGDVGDVTASGFKVTTRDGSVWTVAVNDATTYAYGSGDGTLADVKAGETVVVAGTPTGDNQLTALSVRVAPDRAVGTVTAKTTSTITIQQRDGSSLTVHVDADTTYRVAGAASADLGDVAVDMAIGVTGRARADGSIDADVVAAGRGRGLGLGFEWGDGDGPGFPGRGGRGGFGGPDGFGGSGPGAPDGASGNGAAPTT